MLTGITLENFKAFKEPQFIPIKPITLVFGPNSAGKSSIVYALAFLQHVFENNGACNPLSQRVGWETFDLGGWNNLVFNHDIKNTMRIGLQFSNCTAMWGFSQTSDGPSLSHFFAKINKSDSEMDGFAETSESDEAEFFIKLEGGRISLSPNHPVLRSASKSIWQFICTGRSWESPEEAKANPVISYEKFLSIFTEYLEETSPTFTASSFLPGYKPVIYEDGISGNASPFGDSDIRNARVELRNQLSKCEKSSEALKCFFEKMNWSDLLTDSTFEILDKECIELFLNRLHLGPTRTPPNRKINLSIPSYKPWRTVLEDQHVRKSVNSSLHDLSIPYLLEVACKREIYYKPGIDPNVTQSNNIPQEDAIERIQDSKFPSFVNKSGISLAHCDLGYGISTTLPILVAIHASSRKFISIEQPELHIHPRLQTVLGDLFIKSALPNSEEEEKKFEDEEDFNYGDHFYQDPTNNNFFFIETHSEHLILRILRRIRETTEAEMNGYRPAAFREACPNGIKPENVAVLYVEPGEDGSKVIELPVTPDGDFSKPWPGGFFAERVREIYSIKEEEEE